MTRKTPTHYHVDLSKSFRDSLKFEYLNTASLESRDQALLFMGLWIGQLGGTLEGIVAEEEDDLAFTFPASADRYVISVVGCRADCSVDSPTQSVV